MPYLRIEPKRPPKQPPSFEDLTRRLQLQENRSATILAPVRATQFWAMRPSDWWIYSPEN